MNSLLRTTRAKGQALNADEFPQLLNSVSGFAICILDERGHVVDWNIGAQRLTGYTAREIIGKHYSTFFTGEDVRKKLPQKILSAAAKKGSHETEGIRVRKDGTLYWADGVMSAIRDKKNRLRGFARITRDVTKRHELERQKDEFIGIAAHELRTPITTLSLYAQLLFERLKLANDKRNVEMMDDIKNETDRLTHLVDDLLTMSSVQAGTIALTKEEFDIGALAAQVAKSLQGFTKVHQIVVKNSLKRKVHADQDRIRQVLVNLIENAIKYSRKGKIIVSVSPKGRKALVAVQDFGPGIPTEDYKKIFESRYRSHDQKKVKAGGLGLGLYISAQVIKVHRQKLWVESKVGKGSTFYFTLPLA